MTVAQTENHTGGSITELTFPSGGEEVPAMLFSSAETAREAPALVVSTGAGRNIEGLKWLAAPLARQGYVVLVQGYRDGDSRFHLRDVEDIKNAISYIVQLPYIDAQRVGLVGHSRGGSASLRAAAQDVRVRSTAALAPPTDYGHWTRGIRDYAPGEYGLALKRFGAAPEDDPRYYEVISPLHYARLIKTPVLLVHGTSDLRTPAEHSQWMHDALIEAGNRRVELHLLAGLGHAFEDGFRGYGFDTVSDILRDWFAATL